MRRLVAGAEAAADMAALCAMSLDGRAGTAESCADMMAVLKAQPLRDRVPRFLPNAAVAEAGANLWLHLGT